MRAVLFRHFFAFGFSLLFGLYLVPLMIKAAHSLRILDRPDGRIKKQKQAVPYFGGIAVFVPFIATLGLVYPFQNHIMWFFVGITLLLFVGLIDDLKVLQPLQKFAGQGLAVLCFLKGGFSLRVVFFSTYFNIAASTFWMLLVINAFNLVDVMDGLSSLLAMIAAGSFLVIALSFKLYTASLLFTAFIGSLLAFFVYNKPPARIYLGDAGSLFVGGFLAATPLLFSWSSMQVDGYVAPIVLLGVPLLILGIPLIEIASLIVIRTAKGIPFYQGSPHHFSIYLQGKSWSVQRILMFSGGAAFLLSLMALGFLFGYVPLAIMIASLGLFSFCWFFIVFCRRGVRG